MRILFFVTVFLCISFVSFAQEKRPEKQSITVEEDFALAGSMNPGPAKIVFNTISKSGQSEKADSVSIYKFRNAKIKRALSFMTKRDRPKLT